MPAAPPPALFVRSRPFPWAAAALLLLAAASAVGEPEGGEVHGASQAAVETSVQTSQALAAVREEARRYLLDGRSIWTSPLHWDSSEWARAGAIVAVLAILGRKDSAIDATVQRNRSSRTDAVASAVTPLGSYAAVGVSVAALGGGWLLRDAPLRDTGRDAIEAELFAAGIVTPLLKTITGRVRPSQGSDADEFRAFSRNQSFPSGHATEAFAVASVFAARSDGWVVPTLSYTLASMVGLARVHDRAHFASDVFAGAVIGTAIGRSIVHRHTENRERASWDIIPFEAQRGAGLAIRIATGRRSPPEVFASRSGL
jgi:membrane-associated phospholipid phosphatase